jgi:DNA-binding CsgD family transcriptional regulator
MSMNKNVIDLVSDDVFFVEYLLSDGEIYLSASSITFLKVMGLTNEALGKNLKSLPICRPTRAALKRALKTPPGSSVHFIQKLQKTLWEIEIWINADSCVCVGRKADSLKESTARPDRSREKIDASIILELENGEYIVRSVSEKAAELLGASVGETIRCERLKELKESAPTFALDEMNWRGKSIFCHNVFIPVDHSDKKYVLALFNFIDGSSYYFFRRQAERLCAENKFGAAVYGGEGLISSDDATGQLFSDARNLAALSDFITNNGSLCGDLVLFVKMEALRNFHCRVLPATDGNTALVLISERPVIGKNVTAAFEKLTNRERQVLTLVSLGYKNPFIWNLLGVAEGTVKKTLNNIFEKLEITSRDEIIAMNRK